MAMTMRATERNEEHARARLSVWHGLIANGMTAELAEYRCAAWEAEAARRNVQRDGRFFWEAGRGWIDAQRAFRKDRAS